MWGLVLKSIYGKGQQSWMTPLSRLGKGQIKSKWIYDDIDFPNYHLKYLKDFCPESFEVEYL